MTLLLVVMVIVVVALAVWFVRGLQRRTAEAGDKEEHLYEHARVSYRELEFVLKYGHSEAFTIPDAVERGLYPQEYLGSEDRLLRVVPSPEMIDIVVCGDPHRNRVMVLWGGYVNPVTKKAETGSR